MSDDLIERLRSAQRAWAKALFSELFGQAAEALASSQEEIERLTRERDNLWMAYLHAQMCFHGGVRSSNPDQMAHNDVDRALAGNGPKNGAALAAAKRAGRIGGAA